MIFTRSKFKGGIHPRDEKEISRGDVIKDCPVGAEIAIPLTQHIGAPATPALKKGDHVQAGDIIGTPSGFISSLIHSSISGIVKDIDLYPHPMGKKVLSVIITPDQVTGNSSDKISQSHKNIKNLAPRDIVNMIQRAGIVGMGGASFPTHVKLSPPKGKTIETLIINAAECEPFLTADETLIRNCVKEIILGILLLQKSAGARNAIMAIEDNKPEALQKLKESDLQASGIELSILPTRYPQGGEKQLIQAVLNKEVPSGKLPMDTQTLVQNVGTAFAVYEAIYQDKPLIERIISVTGNGVKNPGNFRVKIGTKIKDLLAQAGFEDNGHAFIIMGGPMMGLPVLDMETPVIKSTSGILVFDQLHLKREYPCIRCGRCIEHCPAGLSPTEIAGACNRGDVLHLQKLHALDCMECGCCSYVCPAGIPLVQHLKLSKGLVRENARKP